MQRIFEKVREADVFHFPFPHIILKDALDREFANGLLHSFPSLDVLSSGKHVKADSDEGILAYRQFCLTGNIAFRDGLLNAEVREFLEELYSYRTFADFVSLFQNDLRKIMPEAFRVFERASPDDLGFPGSGKIIEIDGGPCAITPSLNPHPPNIHLENKRKIGGVLLYLKSADDPLPGGAFQMFTRKHSGKIETNPKMVVKKKYNEFFDMVKSVPYEHNMLFAFASSMHSFHAVEPRIGRGPERRTMNISYNFRDPVLDYKEFRETLFARKWRAARYYAEQVPKIFRSFLR